MMGHDSGDGDTPLPHARGGAFDAVLRYVRDRKANWCVRQPAMPPTVVALDADKKFLLEAAVVRAVPPYMGHAALRQTTLAVANQIARGFVPATVVVALDLFETPEWDRRCPGASYDDQRDLLGVYVAGRTGPVVFYGLPYKWHPGSSAPLMWLTHADTTEALGDDPDGEFGSFPLVLADAMREVPFMELPEAVELMSDAGIKGVDQQSDSERVYRAFARGSLRMLASRYGCLITLPESHRYGPDVEEILAEGAAENHDPRDGWWPPPEPNRHPRQPRGWDGTPIPKNPPPELL